jgi:hypothetical protein
MPALTAKRRLLSDSPTTYNRQPRPADGAVSEQNCSLPSQPFNSFCINSRKYIGCARQLGEYRGERSGTGSLLPAQVVFVERVDGEAGAQILELLSNPDTPHRRIQAGWTESPGDFYSTGASCVRARTVGGRSLRVRSLTGVRPRYIKGSQCR